MTQETPVIDTTKQHVPEPELKTAENTKNPEQPKVSPAADLRGIQVLLENGMFPGNAAPLVTKSWHLINAMAEKVEKDAGYEAK